MIPNTQNSTTSDEQLLRDGLNAGAKIFKCYSKGNKSYYLKKWSIDENEIVFLVRDMLIVSGISGVNIGSKIISEMIKLENEGRE